MDIRGLTVHEVWIEAASDIAAEYYASIVFDRAAKRRLVMLSTQGGMDIEEVADSNPDAIARLHVDPLLGFQDFHARRLAFEAGVDADVVRPIGALLTKFYDAFVGEEAMLVEVNPLIVTGDRQVTALDAKVTLDDSSLFRHPENAGLRSSEGEDPQERMARERGLTYVKLDGNVGILVANWSATIGNVPTGRTGCAGVGAGGCGAGGASALRRIGARRTTREGRTGFGRAIGLGAVISTGGSAVCAFASQLGATTSATIEAPAATPPTIRMIHPVSVRPDSVVLYYNITQEADGRGKGGLGVVGRRTAGFKLVPSEAKVCRYRFNGRSRSLVSLQAYSCSEGLSGNSAKRGRQGPERAPKRKDWDEPPHRASPL